jgi:hypothetical protein
MGAMASSKPGEGEDGGEESEEPLAAGEVAVGEAVGGAGGGEPEEGDGEEEQEGEGGGEVKEVLFHWRNFGHGCGMKSMRLRFDFKI